MTMYFDINLSRSDRVKRKSEGFGSNKYVIPKENLMKLKIYRGQILLYYGEVKTMRYQYLILFKKKKQKKIWGTD